MGTININGKTYSGTNIEFLRGKIYIDGKEIKEDTQKVLRVELIGIVNTLKVDVGNVTCMGDAHHIEAGGSVECKNVSGDVESAGSVRCDDISGDVRAAGSVTAHNIKGNVKAGGSVISG